MLVLFHPAKGDWQASVAAAVEAYRERFHQEAVLYSSINAEVCITNDTCLSTPFILNVDAAGRVGGRANGPPDTSCRCAATLALYWAPALLALLLLGRQQAEMHALRRALREMQDAGGSVPRGASKA